LTKQESNMTDRIATVRRFYEIFASGAVNGFDDILTDDWELKPALFGTPGTKAGEQQTIGYLHSVLADITYTVDDIHEAGDTVACRNMLRGTLKAPFLGLNAPDMPIALMTMEFHHFRDQRIASTWHLEDFFGVYQGLLAGGATPVA
jgi:SnoaL-like polyketide cyclase